LPIGRLIPFERNLAVRYLFGEAERHLYNYRIIMSKLAT